MTHGVPLQFVTALYGLAIGTSLSFPTVLFSLTGPSSVFWGAAIVFFLAKFINFHNTEKQGFWIEVSSQVVNGKCAHLRSPSRALITVCNSLVYGYRCRLHTLPRCGHLP